MSSSLKLECKQKKFFKFISNSLISLSFLLIWSWNDNLSWCTPVTPSKTILHQNGQNPYPFSDQKMRKKKPYPLERRIPKLNYVAYTRDGAPRDLHEVISNYHPAICFGMLTTCPLVAIKTILWKRIPFPGNFFQLYLYLWRWPILNYYTMVESQNSWKYKYLYYVILKIKVRVGMKKLHWSFVVTEKQSYLLPGQTVKKTRVNEVMQW